MEFTRGIDPKKAIGIGYLEHIKAEFVRLNYGSDKNQNNNLGILLAWACHIKHREFAKYLVNHKETDINYSNGFALRLAISNRDIPMVKLLTKNGIHISIETLKRADHAREKYPSKAHTEIYTIMKDHFEKSIIRNE